MKTNKLTAAATVLVMVMSLGSAALACDCVPEEPPAGTKGNNGWGNGGDTTNAGSTKGGTAPSKFASTER